jgi:hypothetical protein
VKITSMPLPAGFWGVWGIANTSVTTTGDDSQGDASCELHIDNTFIGGATTRLFIPGPGFSSFEHGNRSLSMFGWAQALAGGSEISLWCRSQFGLAEHADGAIMAITLGGVQ